MSKKATSLAQRLAAYSAAAGVTLAVAPKAGAQVVYTDPPDCDANLNPCYLDFDGDGDSEMKVFSIRHSPWGDEYFVGARNVEDGGDAANAFITVEFYSHGGYNSKLKPLYPDYPVGLHDRSMEYGFSRLFSGRYGCFILSPGVAFYAVGFKLEESGDDQYFGWLRIRRGEDCAFIVEDYAYEVTPGVSLQTGQTEQLYLLAGEASPLTFPPEGGPLYYHATITNFSDEPTTGSALFALTRGPAPLPPPQLLGTFTVPPNDSIESDFSVVIPADLLPGPYVATFYLNGYASSQSFVIHKEIATASEPDAPGQARTHTLSDATPNPSTGRTQLALEVARTQSVRLTVHDPLGREVATLYNGTLAAGTPHTFTLDSAALPAGVYVVRVVGEDFTDARTLTLTR